MSKNPQQPSFPFPFFQTLYFPAAFPEAHFRVKDPHRTSRRRRGRFAAQAQAARGALTEGHVGQEAPETRDQRVHRDLKT